MNLFLPLLLLIVSTQNLRGGDLASKLASSVAAERDMTLKRLVEDIDAYKKSAIEVLQTNTGATKYNDARFVSIRVLGILRVPEAVQPLLKVVDLREPYAGFATRNRGISPGEVYPAAAALVNIGKPAVVPCIDALVESTPERVRILTWILKEIEGARSAKDLLTARSTDQKPPSSSKNLQTAVGYLESGNVEWESVQ